MPLQAVKGKSTTECLEHPLPPAWIVPALSADILVKLHWGKEVVHEVEWGKEPYSACRKHDGNDHKNGIASVEDSWNRSIQAMQIKH